MQPLEINLADPAALRVFQSDTAMYAWGTLRRAKAPMGVAELDERIGAGVVKTQEALDLLEPIGLVRKLRAGGGRRGITYVTDIEELTLVLPTHADDPQIRGELLKASIRRQDELLSRVEPPQGEWKKDIWFYLHGSEFRATAAELKELTQRLGAVASFVDELVRKMDGPPTDEPLVAAHGLFLRLGPLVGIPRDHGMVKIRDAASHRVLERERVPTFSILSKREREVAGLLQQGLSRSDIAARAGLSVDTIGSHCKRIYKKLGISWATELSRYSFEPATLLEARAAERSDSQ